MSVSIVIIDSSDDESTNDRPIKRRKIEQENGIKNEDETFGLKIVQVTSLAEPKPSCTVIEIDSDDNELDKEETIKKIEVLGETCVNENNHEDIKKESFTNGRTSSEDSNDHESQSDADTTKENNEISSKFQDFLDICVTHVENEKYKELIISKIENIKQKFKDCDPEYVNSKSFLKLLESNIEKIKLNPVNTIIYFKNIYEELKSRKWQDDLDLNEKQEYYVAKLRKTMRLLDKKIKKLEEAEVDFDADNDSSYIMLERYKKKFVEVHKKYCSYTKGDVNAGRMTLRKLDFSASDYVEINRALDKLYMKEKKFPLYHEVEASIRSCIKEKDINISEISLQLEIKKMHQEMGKLVQRRRKCELEDIHSYFLGSSIDPALEDSQLKSVLEEQGRKGEQKMEEVFEAFTRRQLQGEDPVVSPDTDDSNIQTDQDESETKENKQ